MKPARSYSPGKILLTLLASLLLTVTVGAQRRLEGLDQDGRWANGVSEAWWFADSLPDEDIRKLIAQWEKIAKENLTSKGNEWAGDYFTGSDTHGEYLRWSPESGFVIINVDKCSAQVEGFSYGKVSSSSPLNQFIPDKVLSSGHGHGQVQPSPATINFVPVRFRNARLLIPETEMPEFGDYLAGLGRFNGPNSIYYVDVTPFFVQLGKESGGKKEVGAAVPPGYEKFLKKPIEASIIMVTDRRIEAGYSYESPLSGGVTTYEDRVSVTSINVNVGDADGVKPGMILKLVETGEEVIMTRVSTTNSTGIIIRFLDKRGRDIFYDNEAEHLSSKVKTGWKLTTSPF